MVETRRVVAHHPERGEPECAHPPPTKFRCSARAPLLDGNAHVGRVPGPSAERLTHGGRFAVNPARGGAAPPGRDRRCRTSEEGCHMPSYRATAAESDHRTAACCPTGAVRLSPVHIPRPRVSAL